MTSSDKCVIEVDIVPDCMPKKRKGKETDENETKPYKQLFVRDGGSSRNLLPTTSTKLMEEYNQFVEDMASCHNSGNKLKRSTSIFLVELNPTAVLDFDPESAKHGYSFTSNSRVQRSEDIANKLKLTRNTSWVFCNGGIEDETPSDIDEWLMEKGASIRDVISFLCRKDVLPNKRFLVIFLLLSTVSERMDPLVETFTRCGINISGRCIYDLSFAEVNGTILSLLSKNRRSSRFLPCGGGSKVSFEKKVERSLSSLEVLCVNQCDGGNKDQIVIEENFYKGGKVSWWNFYFSEQPASTPFIKRDKFDFIMDTVIPDLFPEKCLCGVQPCACAWMWWHNFGHAHFMGSPGQIPLCSPQRQQC
ncbi:hypothetical protein F7725_001581 [Dissostichus mawsoni]|uniref:Uncharacterized protein n=1 Tax=Dissostichus mawsoni TaxID=36200 RepID=A0A7J5Y011_DISMA|nr:hypothetical protein F7725_001581 [Dissostichus mawsoni]